MNTLKSHKGTDRMWDKFRRPPDREPDNVPMFYPDRELKWFMQSYKGTNPAWDFIQYCLKNKLL